jgi:Spy/CpxP family protein refolding chaperone
MMTRRATSTLFLPALLAFLGGCARSSSHALPGDSVSDDGGSITLSPPRLSTAPEEAREAREGLGPIESRLYPPELIMEHQAELGITADQTKALLAETERGQSEMVHLQWDLQGEKEKLVKLLDPDHVDEAKVQAEAAQVMDRETKVKASHLGMLIRVKNILTTDQQKKLRDIRTSAEPTQFVPSSPTPPTPPFPKPNVTNQKRNPSPPPLQPRAPRNNNPNDPDNNPGY